MKIMKFKRALLLTMLLAVSLSAITGGTIAWFTETVESEKNVIQAGNLDVELYYQLQDQTTWTPVAENTNLFKTNTLWEPGHTEVIKLKVANEGSLSLKYQLSTNVAAETGSTNVLGAAFNLSDHIKSGVIEGDQNYSREQAVAAVDASALPLSSAYLSGVQQLLPNEEKVVTMVVYMPTSVGNEANYAKGAAVPQITLGVKLNATQLAYEDDSFGPEYDAGAFFEPDTSWYDGNPAAETFYISTAEELAGLAKLVNSGNTLKGKTIQLTSNINLLDSLWTPIGNGDKHFCATFDGNGKTVSNFTVEGEKNLGLFGYAQNGGNIKNLTVKNATVKGVDYVGAILGRGYTTVANCHVENVTVIATPAKQPDGTYDGGAKAGGVVGQLLEGSMKMENCTAKNVKVIGYRDIGAVLGMAHNNNIVTNCSASDSEVSYLLLTPDQKYGDGSVNSNIGEVIGRRGSNVVESGTASSNVATNSVYVYGLKLTTMEEKSGKITVSDKEGLLNLGKLNENWVKLFSDGNGNKYSNYPIKNYYYSSSWDIILENDIDLGGVSIQPIQLGARRVFDGQNHTIKNATIVTSSTTENKAGLFDATNCSVANLNLDNIQVTGSNVGGSTVGVLTGSCNKGITNVTVTNSSAINGKYTGGIVGHGYTDITNCTVKNTIVKGGYKLGGLIGYICADPGKTKDVTGNTLDTCTVDGLGNGQYAGGKTEYVMGKVVGNYNCAGTCNNNTITGMTTSANENIGRIESNFVDSVIQ